MIEKATGKMLVGIAAPSEKNLTNWLKEHPSFQVLLHKKTKGQSSFNSMSIPSNNNQLLLLLLLVLL